MTVPALSVTPAPASTLEADVLVLGVSGGGDGPKLLSDEPAFAGLAASLSSLGVTGAADELVRTGWPGVTARSVALIGVGDSVNVGSLRYAAGSAARQLRGVDSLALALPTADEHALGAVLEGAAIGAYSFTAYRSASLASTKTPAARVAVSSPIDASGVLDRATAAALAVHTVRDLVNTPPSDLYPETFARAAVRLAEGLPVGIEVLAERELAEGGYGGILGVGAGSVRGPRLVRLSYSPAGAARHLALVGKGITFDSGGLSLKPAASMVGMKYDMTGAATVLAVTLAAARLALPVRITGWLCLAENMPSGSAIRPNDVLRMRGGKTVEVLNTDAEGRLVLADGLVAACEEQPDAVIDVATLTGAARVALGDRCVGAMGDRDLVAELVEAAEGEGEEFWPMPLPDHLRPLLNSEVADIANAKPGNTSAGMLLAGVFLREFIGRSASGQGRAPQRWAHLDIAGPANNGGAGFGFTGTGPSGVTVRTLLAIAARYSAA